MLDYILELKKSGLSLKSVKVHLTAITAFLHKIDGYFVFTHPTRKRFFKGMGNLFPQIRRPTLVWDLNLVLKCLTRPPFEFMATCSLLYPSMKTAFLVPITSAWRVRGGLMAYPPLQSFSKTRLHYDHNQNSYQKYLQTSS